MLLIMIIDIAADAAAMMLLLCIDVDIGYATLMSAPLA